MLGDRTLEIVGGAKEEVVIVAPYIKAAALNRVLSQLTECEISVTCVTRWLPEDIAFGVCDLDVLAIVNAKNGGRLLVHPQLHAKYYRGDERCLIGSANLTHRGLGWTVPANVELLIEIPSSFPGLRKWEAALIGSAVPVTTALRDQISREAERIRKNTERISIPEIEDDQGSGRAAEYWVPRCSVPDCLWDVYAKSDASKAMLESTVEAALDDLNALRPPPGLSREHFYAYVAGIMKQMPLIVAIDNRTSHGLSDTEAEELLEEHLVNVSYYAPERNMGDYQVLAYALLGIIIQGRIEGGCTCQGPNTSPTRGG